MVISTYGILGFSLQEVTELRAKYLSQVPLPCRTTVTRVGAKGTCGDGRGSA